MKSAISSKQKSDLGESDNKWVLLNNRSEISTIIIFYVGPIVKTHLFKHLDAKKPLGSKTKKKKATVYSW